jgi:two-component system, response regulator
LFRQGKYSELQKNRVPILILLDLRLPKIDGHDVIKKIKSDVRTRDIPITIFSQYEEEPEINICYSEGANSYIVKPKDMKTFAQTIAQLGKYWMGINLVRRIFI